MDRTACTEPQCLYSRAIPLLPLWALRPIQSLSACTRVHLMISFALDYVFVCGLPLFTIFSNIRYSEEKKTLYDIKCVFTKIMSEIFLIIRRADEI